jgi:hypothetical protein
VERTLDLGNYSVKEVFAKVKVRVYEGKNDSRAGEGRSMAG